jgi:hypothetical protein
MFEPKVEEVSHPIYPTETDTFCPESHHDAESLGLDQDLIPRSGVTAPLAPDDLS